MGDSIVVVRRGRVLFGASSQRDANEAQVLVWEPAREHEAGSPLRCTWIEIPQASRTNAVLLSRPHWMWGADMGTNEHGVTIGCAAVLTGEPTASSGLVGPDLVRLALERASSSQAAIDVMVQLLHAHGQGGSLRQDGRGGRLSSAFLVADREQANVFETAGTDWAVDRVWGSRALSNCLTIPGFADRHLDWRGMRRIGAHARRARALELGDQAACAQDIMRILRDHGGAGPTLQYGWLGSQPATLCMHAAKLATGGQSTASWVSDLGDNGVHHWATATAAPCLSVFKPAAVREPLDLGRSPTHLADDASLWWRHERLHRQLMRDPEHVGADYLRERDALEGRWHESPPCSAEAFAEADGLLRRALGRLATQRIRDRRPWSARRYWKAHDRSAGWV